ncbi:cold-shock protein [Halomonas huangheensis]|uniref:Cold-shock protein n=1 Tax=Halomonas huangheensis TaxID=1178482 RepID=W1N2Y1_9GAMM|nr:cold shock domain-containing protein [Halomonas huangheensis]ALM51330.1 DNA-binding protein [Halomonas huangheensis]ERL49546.1 cold-shock protein [Halomonas huangheensis]
MKRRVVIRCGFVSLLLAAPSPLLITLLLSLVTGVTTEQLLAIVEENQLLKGYVATAAGVFALLLVATLAVNALTPQQVSLAGVEDDDREIGEVKWFNVNKGYGFITRDDGEDVFVHFRAIRGRGHRTLAEGQKVRYYVVKNDRGLQADDVTVIT